MYYDGDAYKNYNAITSNVTLTIEASKNYFLKGPITINNGVTFTIAGTGVKNNLMPYIGRGIQTEYKIITLSEF